MKSTIELSSGLGVSIKILSLLKKRKDIIGNITVGTFTNCRECGYTYIITSGNVDGKRVSLPMDKWFTFCTYEHRNSDSIIINGKKGLISMSGDLPYCSDSKWDDLGSVGFGEFEKATDKLVELINNLFK